MPLTYIMGLFLPKLTAPAKKKLKFFLRGLFCCKHKKTAPIGAAVKSLLIIPSVPPFGSSGQDACVLFGSVVGIFDNVNISVTCVLQEVYC